MKVNSEVLWYRFPIGLWWFRGNWPAIHRRKQEGSRCACGERLAVLYVEFWG